MSVKWKLSGAIILLTLLTLSFQACNNPFGSNDNGPRFSPRIKNLDVSRTSNFCGVPFVLSFDYDDPQDDIINIYLTFTGEDNSGSILDSIGWVSNQVDLSTKPGTAVVTYTIDCDLESPSGNYSLIVTVDDKKGHESNELVTEIRLL